MGMIKRESVREALHGPKREFGVGLDAFFTPINEEWGYKYYADKKICRITYEAQKLAHENGLAPAVGECYNMRDKFGSMVYGYVTEAVVMLGEDVYGEFDEDDMDYDDWHLDDVTELRARLRELFGRHFFDLHSANYGWLKNGQLVCIDFSICAC
jgi:hypothetical protein